MIEGPLLSAALLTFAAAGSEAIAGTSSDLLADSLSKRSYLLVAEPWDPLSRTRRTVTVSSDGYASHAGDTLPEGDSMPHQLFRARLEVGQVYNVESRVMSGGQFTENAVPSFGESAVIIADNDQDMLAHLGYDWRSAPLREYVGRPEWDLSSFIRIDKGEAGGIESDTMRYRIRWGDMARSLRDDDLQSNLYRGTGTCLRFRGGGTGDRVTYGDNYDVTGSFTAEALIWPSTLAQDFPRLVSKDDGTTGWVFAMAGSGTGDLVLFIRGGSSLWSSGGTITTAGFQRVSGVYDASANILILYRNAVEIGRATGVTTSPSDVAHIFSIGARHDGANDFSGRIDDVRLWNIARTPDEIASDMDREITGTPSGLIFYDKFDTATGATSFVTIGAANGTITGASWAPSLTGGPSVAGRPIPKAYGRFKRLEPVHIGEVAGVGWWQINDGSMGEFTTLEHKGLEAYTYDGDVADLAAMDVAAPIAGHWTSCKALGIFKLNATVDGHLWVSGKGRNVGGYVEDAAGIVKMIALERGSTVDDLDLVAFAVTSAAYPAPVWIATRLDPIKPWDLMRAAMANLQGWVTVHQGKITVGVLDTPGTPRFTLDENVLRVDGVRRIAASVPVKQTRLGYDRYGLPLGPSDLSSLITDPETRFDLQQEYRFYATAVDADVVAANSSAPVLERFTSIALPADAAIEAEREQAYWREAKQTFYLPLTEGLHQYAIGDDVQVTTSIPLEGLEAGFLGTVVALVNRVPDEVAIEAIGSVKSTADVGYWRTADGGYWRTADGGNWLTQ